MLQNPKNLMTFMSCRGTQLFPLNIFLRILEFYLVLMLKYILLTFCFGVYTDLTCEVKYIHKWMFADGLTTHLFFVLLISRSRIQDR